MVEGTIGDRARPLWSFLKVLHWGGIDFYIFGSGLGDTIIVCSFDFLSIFMACTHVLCELLLLLYVYDTRISHFRPSSLVMNDTRYINQISSSRVNTRRGRLTHRYTLKERD